MNIFTKQDLDILIEQGITEQCNVSIFMPTFRSGPDAQQGPSRLKNLVREAEVIFNKKGIRTVTADKILAPVRNLITDTFFWQNQSDGLAVFTSPRLFKCCQMPLHFKELVMVASRFNIKPLFPLITEDQLFYILGVSQKDVKLLQCTRFGYHELPISGKIPTSLAEAMKYEDLDRESQFHGHIGMEAVGTAMISHGRTIVQEKKDRILRFFQEVDQGLKEILRDENAPLIFSGVDYLFPIYRQANSYTNLMETFISGNPDKTALQSIHKAAWIKIAHNYRQKRADALARYHKLAGTGFTSIDPASIISNAMHGKIDTLFVDEKYELWGSIDNDSVITIMNKKTQTCDEDLLDITVTNTLTSRGSVYMVSTEELPDGKPIVAILRQ